MKKKTFLELNKRNWYQRFRQVVGAKYIRLYDASQDPASLYPHQGLLSNTSQVR